MSDVLVLSFSDLSRDPRVNRQIRYLGAVHRVTAAGLAPPEVPGIRFVPLSASPKPLLLKAVSAVRLLLRRYETYYWRKKAISDALARLRGCAPDLVVANDAETLPLAIAIARGAPVLFDAHEYAPLEFEDRWAFRVFESGYRSWICRTFVPRAAAMTTVCDGIAERYALDTGVRPEVIWNAADYEDLEPVPPEPERIRLVHHGAALRSRRIETMIRTMRHLDGRFTLDLVLVGHDRRYLARLRREASRDPRIRFLPPVPMRELPRFLNRYDVGLFLLEPVNFNYRHALPNKLFEFVQARLAVAIGPSPEMARLVREHHLGVVAQDFSPETLASLLASLGTADVLAMKRSAHASARVLSADRVRESLLSLAARLLGGRGNGGGRPCAA